MDNKGTVQISFSDCLLAGDISADIIVAAGCFSSYIILAATGVVREFSIKGGSFELTSKLEKDMESVKTNVNETKRDISERILTLTQSMQSLQVQSTFRQSVNQTTVVEFFFSRGNVSCSIRRVKKLLKHNTI